MLLAQAVAVSGRIGRMVARAIAFDRKYQSAGTLGVFSHQIDSVPGHTVLRYEVHALCLERCLHIGLEGIGSKRGLARVPEALTAAGRILKIKTQQLNTARLAAVGIHVAVIER